MVETERHIIEGCKQGNLKCQRGLYEQFYGYGLKVALRFVQNREEAVEILNDTFLKVFNKIHIFDSFQPFKPWFRRILIHTTIDYHRANHKFPKHTELTELEEATFLTEAEFPMPIISPNEEVLPLVQALPPMYRMVFNLYVMEEYSHKEIGELLGINESTSRSNLARAKEKLREMIWLNSNSNSKKAVLKLNNLK